MSKTKIQSKAENTALKNIIDWGLVISALLLTGLIIGLKG